MPRVEERSALVSVGHHRLVQGSPRHRSRPPEPPREAIRFYEAHGIEYVPDFDDVLRRADVYACDNSSTLYEFASTGRPVVVLNAPWYRWKHIMAFGSGMRPTWALKSPNRATS